jgi:acetoin utilization protein AcuC
MIERTQWQEENPMEAAFICSEELWSRGFGEAHPLKPERLKRACELLMAHRAFDAPGSHLVPPRPASREELLLFHAAEYVDAVASLSDVQSLPALSGAEGPAPSGAEGPALSKVEGSKGRGEGRVLARRYGFRPDETPAFSGMYETEGLKVGAALVGAELVAEGRPQAAFSFAGGQSASLGPSSGTASRTISSNR